jgi:hypothetical protein
LKFPVFSHLWAYQLAALQFTRPPKLARLETWSLLGLHALGLFALAQLTRVSLFWAALVVAFLLISAFVPRWRDVFAPALLAPFWFVYAAIGLRYMWIRLARGDVPGYFEYALPDARVLLRFEFLVAAALCYAGIIFLSSLLKSRGKAFGVISMGGALLALAWAAWEFFGHRTFGATGSDPYAYAQMGVDLVTRGSFAHRFALFPLVAPTQWEWFPILHVGYRLPFDAQGDAITVWSPGGAVAFAVAYALGGERALYWVNPFFSLAGALAAALLAWELTRLETRPRRVAITALVCVVMLTSREIVNWAGVTMADAQALFFSTLAFYGALRVYRFGSWRWTLLTGVAWGLAYQVRHTQLVMALAFLPLLLFSKTARKTRARNLAFVAVAAFAAALPDLWYHQMYLGSWLTPESEELALYSLHAIAPTLLTIGQSALVAAEFGWLCVFVLCGIVWYARRARVENGALWLWLAAAWAVHLPYAALRLRDLIPEFPIAAFYAAYGIVALVGALWARQRVWATLVAACVIFIALEWNVARVWNTLPRVIEPAPARFGAMSAPQRASFDAIARLTPQSAIIGASLNSGALDLYAQRAAFRPADWSSETLDEFLSVTQGKGRAVFLLEDSAALSRVAQNLRGAYRVERVTTLDVPLFGDAPIANPGVLWRISGNGN